MIHPALSLLVAGSVLAMAAFPGHAAPKLDDPLATLRGKARILVVVAPAADDPRLMKQRDLFGAMKAGAAERDLAFVEAVGSSPEAETLRKTFGLGAGFHAVLVGRDGGAKLTSADPLGADQLFPTIDAMPMRQDEMRKR